jgi:hypothetical protein
MASLQRAETRIKSTAPKSGVGNGGADADIFMIKNLLILKNELMTLEIGDVRGGDGGGGSQLLAGAASSLAGNMHHYLLGGGLLSSFGSLTTYIPGSSLWSRSGANTPAGGATPALGSTPRPGAGAPPVDDAGEQLDGLLRQAIYGFTKRWAGVLNEARGVGGNGKMLGGRNVGKVERELEEMLERAFSGQPEVVGKLKEAIEIEAQALVQAMGEKKSYVTRV